MSFLQGLLAARAHLAFLVGLAAAFLTVRAVEGRARPAAARSGAALARPELARALPLRPRSAALDAREQALARAAWSYLERNTDPGTGLAPAVQGHFTATLWDLGSQLWAVLAAEDLALVPAGEASRRLGRAVASLGRLPLCEGTLPGKSYDVRTLAMVTPDGRPAPEGLGWSALDVARVLGALSVVALRHPELAGAVRGAVGRWRLDALVDGAGLRGATRGAGGRLETYQEGRLGYEQHAAKSLLPWGLPVAPLLDPAAHAAVREVLGGPVPVDDRHPRDHGGARAPALSEPWILDALENGLDPWSLDAARALLAAQERRFERTGRLTAVSEDHLDRPPWFSYSAVADGDETWAARDAGGLPAPEALTFSTKAAVAWSVLFEGAYPRRLREAAAELVLPGEGVLAGRYDTGEPNRALALNTSAVVLEALAYRLRGPARATLAAGAPAPAGRPHPAAEARR